jgi:hypothetical protein
MPIFDYYADFVWGVKNNSVLMNNLQVLHNKAAKIILNAHPLSSASESLRSLNWQPLTTRRHFHRCLIMHKCLNNDIDFKFNFKFSSDIHSYVQHSTANRTYIWNASRRTGGSRHSATMLPTTGIVCL